MMTNSMLNVPGVPAGSSSGSFGRMKAGVPILEPACAAKDGKCRRLRNLQFRGLMAQNQTAVIADVSFEVLAGLYSNVYTSVNQQLTSSGSWVSTTTTLKNNLDQAFSSKMGVNTLYATSGIKTEIPSDLGSGSTTLTVTAPPDVSLSVTGSQDDSQLSNLPKSSLTFGTNLDTAGLTTV